MRTGGRACGGMGCSRSMRRCRRRAVGGHNRRRLVGSAARAFVRGRQACRLCRIAAERDEQIDVVGLALDLDLVIVGLEERGLASTAVAGRSLPVTTTEVAERGLHVERMGRDQANVGGRSSARSSRVDESHFEQCTVLAIEATIAYQRR